MTNGILRRRTASASRLLHLGLGPLTILALGLAACGSPSAPGNEPPEDDNPPPPTTGGLQVTSTPAGAAITLDGAASGRITPWTFSGLAPGAHAVRLALDGYLWTTDSVRVVAGDTVSVSRSLRPGTPVYVATDGDWPHKVVEVSYDAGETWESGWGGTVGAYLIHGLAAHPREPATLYSLWTTSNVSRSSVFRTTDGGETWRGLAGFMVGTNLTVEALGIGGTGTDTLYAGILGYTGYANAGTVLVSTDAGTSWSERATGLPPWGNDTSTHAGVNSLAVDPRDARHAFAGMDATSGIFRTHDAGLHWERSGGGIAQPVEVVAIDPTTPDRIYAGTTQGLYRSTDAGTTWAFLTTIETRTLLLDPANPARLYIGGTGLVHRSDDRGVTWQPLTAIPDAQGWVRAIGVDPRARSRLYAATGMNAWRSEDGGLTWRQIREPYILDLVLPHVEGAPGSPRR